MSTPAVLLASCVFAALASALPAQLEKLLFPNPEFATSAGPLRVAAGDLDRDGDLDLAVATAGVIDFFGIANGRSIDVLLGNGDGTFRRPLVLPTNQGPRDVAIADFDGDGDLDIVSLEAEAGTATVHRNSGDGVHYSRASFAIGPDPVALGVADLDGDGDLDVAATNEGGGVLPFFRTVTLLRNNGSGSLSLLAELQAGLGPHEIAVADADNDGDPDILTADIASATASLFLNAGKGSFASAITFTEVLGAFGAPSAVAIGDVTGDTLPDLLIGMHNTVAFEGELRIRPGLGGGTFGAARASPIGRVPTEIVVRDLEGDGDLDAVAPNDFDDHVALLRNEGLGSMALETVEIAPVGSGVAFGDVDADGADDLIATGSASDRVSVARGDGNGGFRSEFGAIIPVFPRGGALVDVDGDGFDDAVTAGDTFELAVVRGAGGGTFGLPEVLNTMVRPTDLTTGDFDRDRDVDVAICGDRLEIRLNAGDGTFAEFSTVSLPQRGGQSVASTDLDRDGDLDLAVTHLEAKTFGESQVTVLRGSGGAAFSVVQVVPFDPGGILPAFASDPLVRSAFADLDADGRPELLVVPHDPGGSLPNDRLLVFPGLPGGLLGEAASVPLPPESRNLAVGDLDGDRHLDVAVAVQGVMRSSFFFEGTTVALLYGNGDGTFRPLQQVGTGQGPGSVVIGDIDLDGTADLATVNSVGTLSVLLGDGVGGFVRTLDFGFGRLGLALFARDVDNDGRIDVAAINQAPKQLTVLRAQLPSTPPRLLPYGCGVNPAGSLVVVSGLPALGATLTLGVDNPLGTQRVGSIPVLLLSGLPDPAFPCGTAVSGFGMAGSTGELLVSPAGSIAVVGPPWIGPGSPVPFPIRIPLSPSLIGRSLFTQGALVDPGPGALRPVGLTTAIQAVVGG